MKNVFITGGAGYIGSHCAISLLKNGYDPENFSSINNNVGFIKVVKNESLGGKYPYMCVDGNHRLFLLKKIYKDKKIRVLID